MKDKQKHSHTKKDEFFTPRFVDENDKIIPPSTFVSSLPSFVVLKILKWKFSAVFITLSFFSATSTPIENLFNFFPLKFSYLNLLGYLKRKKNKKRQKEQ